MNFECKYWTTPKSEKAIQAIFWMLRTEEVLNVEYFTAK